MNSDTKAIAGAVGGAVALAALRWYAGRCTMEIPQFDTPADPYAERDAPIECDPTPKPGVIAFRDWVLAELGGKSLGIVRACDAPWLEISVHNEGRGWDWAPPNKAAADELIACLLKERNRMRDALARRAGIRVIIWQRRIWISDGQGWRDYTKKGGDPHTGHVHFAFSRRGAAAQTSLYVLDESGHASVRGMADKVTTIYVDDIELGAAEGVEVPARRTALTEQRLAEVLAAGHVRAFGQAPSYNRLGVAWSQVNHETGRTASAYNYNWGNLIKTGSWAGDWHKLGSVSFRAYPSELAGAEDYWRLLARRYSEALEAFDAGEPQEAAELLHAAGYFEQDPAIYGKSLSSLFAEYERKFSALGWAERLAPLVAAVGIAAIAAWLEGK